MPSKEVKIKKKSSFLSALLAALKPKVLQKCNSGRCLKTKMSTSSTRTYKDVECPICYETNSKVAMQKNCDHLFCSDCLKNWRKESKNCPICRTKSGMTIYCKLVFEGKEKYKLFRGHFDCILSSDVLLKEAYYNVNQAWRSLFDVLLGESISGSYEGLDRLLVACYASINQLKVYKKSEHHASFREQSGSGTVVVLVCKMEDFYWQVTVISDDMEKWSGIEEDQFDELYADRMMLSFVKQLVYNWREIPKLLNPAENMFFVLRRFARVTCEFYLKTRTKAKEEVESELSDEPFQSSLRYLRHHNVTTRGKSQDFYQKYADLVAWEIFTGPPTTGEW